jgi:hypothetical protein
VLPDATCLLSDAQPAPVLGAGPRTTPSSARPGGSAGLPGETIKLQGSLRAGLAGAVLG